MKTCLKTAAKNDMKVRVIGDITRLDEDIQKRILELEEATKNNSGLNFQIAINYGSRDEMVRAIRKLAKDCIDGKVNPEEIEEQTFEQYLDTKGIPDPDLMIRTSGELRLPIICYGSWHIQSFILQMFHGRISVKKNWKRRLNSIITATDVTAV